MPTAFQMQRILLVKIILAAISEVPAQELGQGSQLMPRSCRYKALSYILRFPERTPDTELYAVCRNAGALPLKGAAHLRRTCVSTKR